MTVNTRKGKITAKKYTLNIICIAFSYAADKFREECYNGLADSYNRVSEDIYNALNDSGYYN